MSDSIFNRDAGSEIILKKLKISLLLPINLAGGPDAVIKPELRCEFLTGRTGPDKIRFAGVTIRIFNQGAQKLFLRFAFFPANCFSSQNEKIRNVAKPEVPSFLH